MDHRITDAELVIMELIWNGENVKAIEIANKAKELRGWEKNTTYTMITRLIKKGIIERVEPGYVCKALVDKETVRREESRDIVNKLFHGSLGMFARAFINDNKLTESDIEELCRILDENK